MYREEWLMLGLSRLADKVFAPHKYKLPLDIKLSCGWPSQRALSFRQRTIGQCWYPQGNGNHELFISPTIADSVNVLDITCHEVVHTLVGKAAAHKSPFAYVAKRIGLTGKMTATVAGPELKGKLEEIVKEIGPYPHKPIEAPLKLRAANNRRYLTARCDDCDYEARVEQTIADALGFPICPGCSNPLLGVD